MNGRSFEGINGGPILAPGDPDLLGSGVHDSPLVVTCLLVTDDVAVHGLGGDSPVLFPENVAHAGVV